MNSESPFPAHFPEGCPPLPHRGPSGTYYRLVSSRNDPPEIDFVPGAELPEYVPRGGKGARCRDCALSVFDDPEAARNFLANRPLFGKRHLAEMRVAGAAGVMHPEPGGHLGQFNWWLTKGLSFRAFFRRCLDAG